MGQLAMDAAFQAGGSVVGTTSRTPDTQTQTPRREPGGAFCQAFRRAWRGNAPMRAGRCTTELPARWFDPSPAFGAALSVFAALGF